MRLECRLSATIPFRAYRLPEPGGGYSREVELISSLEHFFQSERFRGVCEPLRLEVLSQPTSREARKLALAHISKQRADWEKRQPKVLRCGMWFQCIEHPWITGAIQSGAYVFDRRDPFWRPKRGDGAFRKLEIYLRDKLSKPMKVFVFGTGDARNNQFRLDMQFQKLFRNQRPDELLLGDGYGFDDLAEAWAIEHMIPVRRRPRLSRLARIADSTLQATLSNASHAILFAGKSPNQEIARLALLAKQAGVVSRLLFPPQPAAQSTRATVTALRERGGK